VARSAWHNRNSYFDERTGRDEYMETADLLLAPTPFQRARKHGVKSALLSSKKKTTTLLRAGADLILTAEEPPEEWVRRLGSPAGIYSREINYWLMTAVGRDTVFGEMDAPSEPLPAEYRAHGSLHEMDVPIVIYNAPAQLKPEEFQYNRDVARWLYAG
jgi:hypothetical protein